MPFRLSQKLMRKKILLFAFSQGSILAWDIAIRAECEEERKSASGKSLSYANNALSLSNEVENVYC